MDVVLSERDKMLSGAPYDPGCPELVALRTRAQRLMRDYNQTIYGDAQRAELMQALLGTWNGAVIRPPFHVDYGVNIHFGPGCFANFNLVVLDVCPVHIGARSQIGPNVQILTADHPRDAATRATGAEWGPPGYHWRGCVDRRRRDHPARCDCGGWRDYRRRGRGHARRARRRDCHGQPGPTAENRKKGLTMFLAFPANLR